MADGRWPMADGRWPMPDARWPIRSLGIGHPSSAIPALPDCGPYVVRVALRHQSFPGGSPRRVVREGITSAPLAFPREEEEIIMLGRWSMVLGGIALSVSTLAWAEPPQVARRGVEFGVSIQKNVRVPM